MAHKHRQNRVRQAETLRARNMQPVPPGASLRPIQPLQPQMGVAYGGRYPGQNLAGDNTTPVQAYTDHSPVPQNSVFPVGDPIRPVPGLGPRQWQFPVGANISPTPRGTEMTAFETLRNLARAYDGIDLCKRAIHRIFRRTSLQIVPRPEYLDFGEDASAEKWKRPAQQMLEWFQEGPDKRGSSDLTTWMIQVMTELLEIDACGILPVPTRGHTLHALEIVAGDTLQCLMDESGRTPRAPAPAYRQVIQGAPGPMFMQAVGALNGLEMDYLRMTPKADSMYGESPVEGILLRVNQALRKQHFDLVRFTDGATPTGIVETDNRELFQMTPDQVMQLEQMWNAVLAGNDALRVRTKFLQPGFHFVPTRSEDIATAFDAFILNVTLAAFGLTKDEIAFTDSSGRATGQSQEAVTYRNAVLPYTKYVSDLFTRRVIARYDGQPLSSVSATRSVPGAPTRSAKGTWDARYCATWQGIEEPEDLNKRVAAVKPLIDNGTIGRTAALRYLGIPVPTGTPDIPAFLTVQGGVQSVVFPDDLLKHRDQLVDTHGAGLEASEASSDQVKAAMMGGGGMMGGGMMAGGMAGGMGPGGNPIAAQAQAAGKPRAAQQATTGGVSVPQQAAAQQVGAKVAGAAQKPAQTRSDDPAEAGEENDDDADRVSAEPRRPAHRLSGGTPDAAAGRDVGVSGRDAVGADADGAGRDVASGGAGASRGRSADDGALSGGSASSREQRAASRDDDDGDVHETVRGAVRAARGGDDTAARAEGIARASDAEERTEAIRDEWRRYKERATKAVRQGRKVAPFTSALLPADLHVWASERLASARTVDEVRAVFTAVRERERQSVPPSTRVTTNGAEHTGAMLAFMLPKDAAARLADIAGVTEPADELHITLAYLGEAADWTPEQVRALRKMLAAWASEQMAVPVLIGGPNNGPKTFPKSSETPAGEHPIYAPVESEHIQVFRAALMKALTAEGFDYDTTHKDYVPHVTLAWVSDGERNLLEVGDLPSVPLILNTLTLAVGDDHFDFALGPRAAVPEPPVTRHVPVPAPVPTPIIAASAPATVPATVPATADDPLRRLADALARRVELSTAEQMRELRTQVLAAIQS